MRGEKKVVCPRCGEEVPIWHKAYIERYGYCAYCFEELVIGW